MQYRLRLARLVTVAVVACAASLAGGMFAPAYIAYITVSRSRFVPHVFIGGVWMAAVVGAAAAGALVWVRSARACLRVTDDGITIQGLRGRRTVPWGAVSGWEVRPCADPFCAGARIVVHCGKQPVVLGGVSEIREIDALMRQLEGALGPAAPPVPDHAKGPS